MPTFEDFENNRDGDGSQSEDAGYRMNHDGKQPAGGSTTLAPSAPHRGDITEYSPNRNGPPPLNRAAMRRKEQRVRRSKKYTQKINLGPNYKLSNSAFSEGIGDFVKDFLDILKKLWGNVFPKKKKEQPRREGRPPRRNRPRRRGGKNQRKSNNRAGGAEGKDRWKQDRQKQGRGGNRRGGPNKQGGKRSGPDNRGSSNSRAEPPNDKKSSPNPNANRNRRRRRKPSSNQRPNNPSSRKD